MIQEVVMHWKNVFISMGVEKNYDIGIEFYKKSYIMDVNKEYTNDLYINIINN